MFTLRTYRNTAQIKSEKTTARQFDEVNYINRAFDGHPSVSTIDSLAVRMGLENVILHVSNSHYIYIYKKKNTYVGALALNE
jgi:hypothetical protein